METSHSAGILGDQAAEFVLNRQRRHNDIIKVVSWEN